MLIVRTDPIPNPHRALVRPSRCWNCPRIIVENASAVGRVFAARRVAEEAVSTNRCAVIAGRIA